MRLRLHTPCAQFGTRWLVFKDVWLAGGYEFPVTGTDELAGRAWLSFYLDF